MSLVQYAVEPSGLAKIILNRPDKLNAFSRGLCDAYLARLDELEADIKKDRVKLVVIDSSSDKAFCAGADLKERAAMNADEIDAQLTLQRQMMDRTASLPVPTLAVLRGVAFGGGLELALACDLRVAALTAQMGLTELKLAIIPGSGGTQRLARLIGLARAREMIMLSKRLNAPTAKIYGLVNEVNADVDVVVTEYVDAILASGPIAQRAAKRAINGGMNLSLGEALDFERECYEMVLQSRDRTEGLTAFLAKRPPKYQGA